MARRLFTSESVSMGHPDKMCDQISDAVLDAMLRGDPSSRVGCEAATTTGLVFVLGEVNAPGLLTVPTSMTLLQAIAAAGGTNPRAVEDRVMVIRRKGLPITQSTVVNLRSLLVRSKHAKAGRVPDFSNLRHDFYLADADIVSGSRYLTEFDTDDAAPPRTP